MLVVSWLKWWYGEGWAQAVTRIRARLSSLYASFSVSILIQTMFAPWRRIVSGSTGPISQRLRAAADNAVSRLVGFGVRLLALLAAGLSLGVSLIGGALLLIIWPVLPIGGVIAIVIGVLR